MNVKLKTVAGPQAGNVMKTRSNNYPVLGISAWARNAARMTNEAANLSDWRLTTKADRAIRELARELSKGRGYLIAPEQELVNRGILQQRPAPPSSFYTKKYIWAYRASFKHALRGTYEIDLIPVWGQREY